MAPRVLLLSADSSLTTAFDEAKARIGFELTLSELPSEAEKILGSRNFDAVFIDCDDLHGSKQLLAATRKTPANRNSAIVAILSGDTEPADAMDLGATSVLSKPLSGTKLREGIKASCAAFTQRQHQRIRLGVPVYVSFGETIDRLAAALNVSRGGMALRCESPIDAEEQVRVKFQPPGAKRTILARGEVAWMDSAGLAGVRFVSLIGDSAETLNAWIDSVGQSKNEVASKGGG